MKTWWTVIKAVLSAMAVGAVSMTLIGCAVSPPPESGRGPTLAMIDSGDRHAAEHFAAGEVAAVDSAQVRQAYKTYLAQAGTDDNIRQAALKRLADIELAAAEAAFASDAADEASSTDADYQRGVTSTIELLTASLRDYPSAPGNDRVMYKLAKAYDHIGEHEQSLSVLRQLVERYPRSRHYVEARFRLGEQDFDRKNYAAAERAFEEVISSPQRSVFYEKALFKRGWARFKQDYYMEAVDDFMRAVAYRENLPDAVEQDGKDSRLAEYFRGVGLAFSYLESAGAIEDYLRYSPWPGYEYRMYKATADEALKQQRHFDAAATLQHYVALHSDAPERAVTALAIADIWRDAGMWARYTAEFESVYTDYHPEADYWRQQTAAGREEIEDRLRRDMMELTGYYHHRYVKEADSSAYDAANRWYQRYMRHYKTQARQDGMFMAYGDLLAGHGDLAAALDYYAQAALEGGEFVDRDAAYALVVTTDKRYRDAVEHDRPDMLSQHLDYAKRYVRHYPDDPRVNAIVENAANLAFADQRYAQAYDIAATRMPTSGPQAAAVKLIQARASFELARYAEAEHLLIPLLSSDGLEPSRRDALHDEVALAVYRQAETAQAAGMTEQALEHYGRIVKVAPMSDVAARGLVDAIALANNSELWPEAITYAKAFQHTYPNHELRSDVAKKLSFAYLRADQGIDAARAYEDVARLDADSASRMAALWQAGQLYEQHNDIEGAVRAYRRYALQFSEPFPQYMEAMHKMAAFYDQLDDPLQAERWTDRILTAETAAGTDQMTTRTAFIAASAALRKAHGKREAFSRYALRAPFETHLRNKTALMQQASELYQRAYAYEHSQAKTEAMYFIATMFYDFSEAVLQSERPADLRGDDLEMYEIELEDLAFPLEQKAIDMFEKNLRHVQSEVMDQWLKRSVDRLAELFPARYARRPKVESYASLAF